MRRIEKQTSQQRIELENAKKYQAEQNLLRQNYNQKGKDIEKAQLNSIKERVWKKHKQTLQRRKKPSLNSPTFLLRASVTAPTTYWSLVSLRH